MVPGPVPGPRRMPVCRLNGRRRVRAALPCRGGHGNARRRTRGLGHLPVFRLPPRASRVLRIGVLFACGICPGIVLDSDFIPRALSFCCYVSCWFPYPLLFLLSSVEKQLFLVQELLPFLSVSYCWCRFLAGGVAQGVVSSVASFAVSF